MLGIIYDVKIIKYKSEYYSMNFSDNTIKRYSTIDPDVMYIMAFEEGESISNLEKINYPVIAAPIPYGWNFNSFINNKEIKKKLEEYIRVCDKLIIRMPSFTGSIAIEIANNMKKKYLVELVGDVWGAFWFHSLRGKLLAPYMYHLVKNTILNSKNVQYITDDFLQSKYPTRGNSYICPNTTFSRETFNNIQHNCINNRNIKLCTVGDVNVRYKGQAIVIKAIPILQNMGFNVKYYLIGGGDQSYLRCQASRHNVEKDVIFLGQLTHQQVYQYFKNIDIYIQPSYTEAQGRSLLEAMNAGCPCLCSDIGGMRELIASSFRFKAGDYNGLANLISSLDDFTLNEMSLMNWEKAEEYSIEYCEKIRNNMYEEVFGSE